MFSHAFQQTFSAPFIYNTINAYSFEGATPAAPTIVGSQNLSITGTLNTTTSYAKYGTACAAGTSIPQITLPQSISTYVTNNQYFMIEAWVYLTGTPNGYWGLIGATGPTVTDYITMTAYMGGALMITNGTSNGGSGGVTAPAIGVWTHVFLLFHANGVAYGCNGSVANMLNAGANVYTISSYPNINTVWFSCNNRAYAGTTYSSTFFDGLRISLSNPYATQNSLSIAWNGTYTVPTNTVSL